MKQDISNNHLSIVGALNLLVCSPSFITLTLMTILWRYWYSVGWYSIQCNFDSLFWWRIFGDSLSDCEWSTSASELPILRIDGPHPVVIAAVLVSGMLLRGSATKWSTNKINKNVILFLILHLNKRFENNFF